MPWPLQEAINQGLSILAWYENYTEDEMPVETLWEDSEYVQKHFEVVRQKRDEKYGLNGKAGGLDDEEMIGNDLAPTFKD